MYYYERHIGDYITDTVSLSMLEDGAYNRLIDQYYQTEKPLPLDKGMLYRAARAASAAERKAVDFVMQTYFVATDDGYVHKRIDVEIGKYRAKQDKARNAAKSRWNKSERNADASKTHMQDACERNADAMLTNNQEPITKEKDKPPSIPPCLAAGGSSPTPPNSDPDAKPSAKPASKPKPSGFNAAEIDLPPWLDRADWVDWAEDRRKRGKPISEAGARRQLKRLDDYRRQGFSPHDVIENSIAGGYQGLFPGAKPVGAKSQETLSRSQQNSEWMKKLWDTERPTTIDMGTFDASTGEPV